MTDKEPIKVLENELECVKRQCGNFCNNKRDCKHCDLALEDKIVINAYEEAIQALKIIDKLKIENQSLRMAANSYKSHYNEAKSVAVKEFAERLKKECIIDRGYEILQEGTIDDLVKEMAGEIE